jgi:hypothetical protein
MWFYYLIPIIIHLMFLPFWLTPQKSSWVTTAELVIGILFIPIYLLIVSFKSVEKINLHKFLFSY